MNPLAVGGYFLGWALDPLAVLFAALIAVLVQKNKRFSLLQHKSLALVVAGVAIIILAVGIRINFLQDNLVFFCATTAKIAGYAAFILAFLNRDK